MGHLVDSEAYRKPCARPCVKQALGGESRQDSFLHSNADLNAGEIVHIPCPVSAQDRSFYRFGLHEYAQVVGIVRMHVDLVFADGSSPTAFGQIFM